MTRVIGSSVTALAITALASAAIAAQAPVTPFPAPSVQFGPREPFPPPQQPLPRRPLFATPSTRPAPTVTLRTPPPVKCTMRVIPVDPSVDPAIVKEPDPGVNYAKKEVPPPACR